MTGCALGPHSSASANCSNVGVQGVEPVLMLSFAQRPGIALKLMLTDVGVLANIFWSVLSLFLGEEQVSCSPISLSVQEIVSPVLHEERLFPVYPEAHQLKYLQEYPQLG